MTEILLINPKLENARNCWLPLGLAYIASYLERYSFKVRIIDANALRIDDEKVVDLIGERPPEIVGITAMTPYIFSAWKIAKSIKQKFPSSLVVLGGHHPSVLPEESLKKGFIDLVVIGEGEETMKEIACWRRAGSPNLEEIKGIAYKSEKEICYTEPRPLIEDLDELPFPARHLFDFPQRYTPSACKKLPVAAIFTSRGCPYRCTFCHFDLFGKRFRARTPENVISEIEYLIKTYGIKEFHIGDDNFALNVERVSKFCDLLIQKKINLPWACVGGIRINTVANYPEIIEKMAKVGFYRTSVGIESGNQQILNNIQKDITLEQIQKAVDILRKNKVFVGGYLMIGNYGENEKTVEDTISFAKSLPLDYVQIMIATPYPGTKFYQQLTGEEKGKLLTNDWHDFKIFTGAVFEWNNLSKAKIDKLYRKAYLRYYFDPKFLIKSVLKFRLSNWKIYLNGSLILFKNLIRYKTI